MRANQIAALAQSYDSLTAGIEVIHAKISRTCTPYYYSFWGGGGGGGGGGDLLWGATVSKRGIIF